jgi:hypothetical protein
MRDVFTIELGEADDLRDIPDDLRLRPCVQELVLRLSRPITFGGNVVSYKFKSLRKDEALLQTQ